MLVLWCFLVMGDRTDVEGLALLHGKGDGRTNAVEMVQESFDLE